MPPDPSVGPPTPLAESDGLNGLIRAAIARTDDSLVRDWLRWMLDDEGRGPGASGPAPTNETVVVPEN